MDSSLEDPIPYVENGAHLLLQHGFPFCHSKRLDPHGNPNSLPNGNLFFRSPSLAVRAMTFCPFGRGSSPPPSLFSGHPLTNHSPLDSGNINLSARYCEDTGLFLFTAPSSYSVTRLLSRAFLRKVQKKLPEVQRVSLRLSEFSFSFRVKLRQEMEWINFNSPIIRQFKSGKVYVFGNEIEIRRSSKISSYQQFSFDLKRERFLEDSPILARVYVRLYRTGTVVVKLTKLYRPELQYSLISKSIVIILDHLPLDCDTGFISK